MKDALIYPLADALNLALHEMKDGRVRGSGTRMLSTGGWTFEAEIMVVSDVVEEHRAGYFVRLWHAPNPPPVRPKERLPPPTA